MSRRFFYAFVGTLLSVGAPVGFVAVRLMQHRGSSSRPRATSLIAPSTRGYAYVTTSTAVAFTIFGFLLGRQADELAKLSTTDPLTGLHNARGWTRRLQEEVARYQRYHHPLALLLVDLDDLKQINDRHGHAAGSLSLRLVGGAIRSELRASDIGARFGGDEFAILAPNTSESSALALAERIRAVIARERAPWSVTASVGVTVLNNGGRAEPIDTDALMRLADTALYQAKNQGKNTVVLIRPT